MTEQQAPAVVPTSPGVYRDKVGDIWILLEQHGATRWHYADNLGLGPSAREVQAWAPFKLEQGFLVEDDRLLEQRPGDEEFGRVRRLLEGRYFTASEHADVVALRELVLDLAAEIWTRVPEGRNRAEALLRLEDVQMRANRGLFAEEPHR